MSEVPKTIPTTIENTVLTGEGEAFRPETARFNQYIGDEEQTWSDLLDAMDTVGLSQPEKAQTLKDLWLDTQLPQVFRDRAMVQLVQRFYVLSDEDGISSGIGFSDEVRQIIPFTLEEQLARDAWYIDTLKHLQATGESVLGETNELLLAVEFFDKEAIGQEEFEQILDLLDIFERKTPRSDTEDVMLVQNILPTYMRYDLGQYNKLPSWRFPLLEDLFSGVLVSSGSSGPTKQWAAEQLTTWLDFQEGVIPSENLPSWLPDKNDIGDSTVLTFFNSLRHRIDKELVGWDVYQRAVRLFGWAALDYGLEPQVSSDSDPRLGIRLHSIVDLVEEVDDVDFADELLLHFLSTFFAERDRLALVTKDSPRSTEMLESLLAGYGRNGVAAYLDRRLNSSAEHPELQGYLQKMTDEIHSKLTADAALNLKIDQEVAARKEAAAIKRQLEENRRTQAAEQFSKMLDRLRADIT